MTNRRPPPPSGIDQDRAEHVVRRSAVESTALLERPLFSDAFDGVPSRDSDEVLSEQTDAERRVVLPADQPTGRYRLDDLADLDDLVDDLPDAHISEFDVSDMDGEPVDIAATTIMQLPPSMIGHQPAEPVEEIAVRKWSAGPQVTSASPLVDSANVTWDGDDDDSEDDRLPPLVENDVPRRSALAPTMPFLSVSAVKAGGFLVDTPAFVEPPSTHGGSLPAVTEVVSAEPGLRDTLDDALAALLAAQACADAGAVPRGLNAHLEKAVELLSRAIDLVED